MDPRNRSERDRITARRPPAHPPPATPPPVCVLEPPVYIFPAKFLVTPRNAFFAVAEKSRARAPPPFHCVYRDLAATLTA